jgi:hypothetical protein
VSSKGISIYYREPHIYLEPWFIPLDPFEIHSDIPAVPGEPIIQSRAEIGELAQAINAVLSLKMELPIQEVVERRKLKLTPLMKRLQVQSYRQLQKGTSYCNLRLTKDEFVINPGFPDENNRGWVGRRETQKTLPLSEGYERVSEIILKHLLDPANIYPSN